MEKKFDWGLEEYRYRFSIGELYEFGSCLLMDYKSSFLDPIAPSYWLKSRDKELLANWALYASECNFSSLYELEKDFYNWYGIEVKNGKLENE